jgi:hypothetical protein
MMVQGTAYWVVARETGELRSETLPQPSDKHVLVRTRASAVSRGTEALVFYGRVPESEWSRMRCPFQSGEFPWPVKYGYAAVGVVEEGPSELQGRRVFCLHPHQDRFIVPSDSVVAVPDAVPDHRATLGANLETALNGLWDSGLAHRLAGADVEIVEPDAARAMFARGLGFRVVAAPHEAREASTVFEVSGRPEGLVAALEIAAFEATIVALSWFGSTPVTLPLGGAFHAKRLTIKSSQVGAVSPSRRGRVSHRDRLTRALDLLADPFFDRLIGEPVPFMNLPSEMARILSRPVTPPVTSITYSG